MNIIDFSEISNLKEPIRAVAIGAFDALHRGHIKLLKTTLRLGKKDSAVITFAQNPTQVLHQNHYLGDVLTKEQKVELFSKMGFKTLILIDFSLNFSKIRGEVFLNEIMKLQGLKQVVVGSDFSCGYKGELTANQMALLLSHCNISLCKVPLKRIGFQKMSSTRVRKFLLRGQIQKARRELGRPVEIIVPPYSDQNISQDVINIPRSSFKQLLPLNGTYRFLSQTENRGRVQFTKEMVRLKICNKAVIKKIILLNIVKETKHGNDIRTKSSNR